MARLAVQVSLIEPQPGVTEMPEFGSRPVLLLRAITVSVPVPESVNAMGTAVAGDVND
jgi:hypothetical protein